jgi:hypothetical protein
MGRVQMRERFSSETSSSISGTSTGLGFGLHNLLIARKSKIMQQRMMAITKQTR